MITKLLRCTMLTFLLSTGGVLAAPVSGVYAADPVPPPSLNGESFFTTRFVTPTSEDCHPNGTSTITFSYTAVASGPYPGTYTETGTVVIGPQTIPAETGGRAVGDIVSFTADFTIVSGDTTITGTKTLQPPDSFTSQQNTRGSCYRGEANTVPDSSTIWLDESVAAVRILYQAQINTPSGDYRDTGQGAFLLSHRRYLIDPDGDGTATEQVEDSGFSGQFYGSDGVTPAGPGPATTVTLNPPAATNTVGTNHTVTASVKDASGQSATPVTVRFTVAGSTSTSGTCTTGADGTCTFTYTGPQLPGADSITACADTNANSACDPAEPKAEATKAWLLPASSTEGKVTGGGQVPSATDANSKVAFGFEAQNKNGSLKGNCSVVDQAPARNILIKCLDVTTLVQSGTHATIFGNATVNGAVTTYRIDVDDNGEPGKDRDTFRIQTSSGYTVSGVISQGNIQAH